MLILTRKAGEAIRIGEQIRLQVIEVSKGFVKIGIDAPSEIKILREEVYERVREENIESSKGDMTNLLKAATLLKGNQKKE
jgi:carbon storage regulator